MANPVCMGPAYATTSRAGLPAVRHTVTDELQRYRVNGIDMTVQITGEGPEVLLVHGFPDTHTVWRKQVDALVAAGYRV